MLKQFEKLNKDFLKNLVLYGLTKGKYLTDEIAKILGIEASIIVSSTFADGEILVKGGTSVRNKDVVLIQSTSAPVNDSLMELLIAIDMLKRASAKSINVIIPYYGYARQDRKSSGREPISAKLVANMISNAGASRVILMDIHSEQIQGFFDIPVDTLKASSILLRNIIKKKDLDNVVIVSPDYGSVKRAREIAKKISVPIAIIDKRRPAPNQVEVQNVLGDVESKNCIIIDDMIDTGGTIIAACEMLKKKNAKSITVMSTHGLFSNNAIQKFKKAIHEGLISDLYITNSIQENNDLQEEHIHVINIADFFADVIVAHFTSNSVGSVYKKYWEKICDSNN